MHMNCCSGWIGRCVKAESRQLPMSTTSVNREYVCSHASLGYQVSRFTLMHVLRPHMSGQTPCLYLPCKRVLRCRESLVLVHVLNCALVNRFPVSLCMTTLVYASLQVRTDTRDTSLLLLLLLIFAVSASGYVLKEGMKEVRLSTIWGFTMCYSMSHIRCIG